MASTTLPQTCLTLEAFLRWPETKPASEYVDGRVMQKLAPDSDHSLVQREVVL